MQAALGVQKSKSEQQSQLLTQLKQENAQLFVTVERLNGSETLVQQDTEAVQGLRKALQERERENSKLLWQVGKLAAKENAAGVENQKLRNLLQRETG